MVTSHGTNLAGAVLMAAAATQKNNEDEDDQFDLIGQDDLDRLEEGGLDDSILSAKPDGVSYKEFIDYALSLSETAAQALVGCEAGDTPGGYEEHGYGEHAAYLVDIVLRSAAGGDSQQDESFDIGYVLRLAPAPEDAVETASFAREWVELSEDERASYGEVA